MAALTGTMDGVIGVDTHRDTLAAAAVDALGAVLAKASASSDDAGYRHLLAFAGHRVPGRRVWALEGTGGYGAGLAAFLQRHDQRVVEVDRPSGRAGETAPRPMRWTLSAQLVRPLPATTSSRRDAATSARRCGCCWPPGRAPS
jgi:Transposase